MDYGLNATGAGTGKIYSSYSGKYYSDEELYSQNDDNSSSYLDFDSYLKLLVAQMSNQDFNNPMSDAEVLAQMAQYSMLEGIKNMTQQSNISYASSLVGKIVTVNSGGSYLTGTVESISIKDGDPYLMIDGNSFKSSTVTDIVDQKTYDDLKSIIGMTAVIEGDDETPGVTGEITNVLFMNGEGWVAVNGHAYKLSDVKQILKNDTDDKNDNKDEITEDNLEDLVGKAVLVKYDEEDENDFSSFIGKVTDVMIKDGESYVVVDGNPYKLSRIEVIENTAEENGEKTEESDDKGELETETSEVNAAAQSYSARSQALVDILMKELDKVDEVSEAGTATGTSDMNAEEVNYVLQTAYIEVPDYSAAFFGDENVLTTSVLEGVDNTYGKSETTYTISNSVTDNISTIANNSYNNISTVSRSTSSSSMKGVTTAAGVSTSDCVPHRVSVEDYPEEAALADALGTRMYDIRYINNHAVTSRIKTGPIIGRTVSGRGITEIGYSGVGQLGEVVTFADGTQRVEILLKNGHSTWLNTSGNLTLDEICTKDGAPGSLSGRLTPSESAIRHYSQPFSNLSQSPLDSFSNYLVAQGHA